MPREQVKDYLRANHMYWRDMGYLIDNYLSEMTAGLQSPNNSSLEMIPTYIEANDKFAKNKKVLVMDAGGTNLRVCLVSFDDEGNPKIEQFKRTAMPGQVCLRSKIEFFDDLAHFIGNLAAEATELGFCFSYPTKILPNLDGRLLVWSKEVQAPEVVGSLIGAELRKAMQRCAYPALERIIILNDSVATLLAGMCTYTSRRYSDYIGYILGTGINCCYSDNVSNTNKLDKDFSRSNRIVINTESGNFTKIVQGRADTIIDKRSADPGKYKQEKLCSGRYFGELITISIKMGTKDSLFSRKFASIADELETISTKDANNYLINPWDTKSSLVAFLNKHRIANPDREILFHLIDELLQRIACITATNMAATIIKSERGLSPMHPVCITVDGTSFYSYHNFGSRVYAHIDRILTGANKRYFEFGKVHDAPIIGSAIAALSQ